jgi:hypothetical protein
VIAPDAASGRLLWAHADTARYETGSRHRPAGHPSVRDGRVFTQARRGSSTRSTSPPAAGCGHTTWWPRRRPRCPNGVAAARRWCWAIA